MEIACFIDYDNLEDSTKRNGVVEIVTRVIKNIDLADVDNFNRLVVRWYGGWYDEKGNLTKSAQSLAAEFDHDFPRIMFELDGSNQKKIFNCQVELAFSLLEIPGDVLHSTYRQKVVNRSVKCSSSEKIGCLNEKCLADFISKTIKSKKCTFENCDRPVDQFLNRDEQKMVDTMLACDLIFANTSFDYLVLVSSDDDFVPILKTILNKNKKFLHLETKPSVNQIAFKYKLKLESKVL